MRLTNEQPITQQECKIESILTQLGYNQSQIQFRDVNRYLRIGYWQQLTQEAQAHLAQYIAREISFEDDECGELYCYELHASN